MAKNDETVDESEIAVLKDLLEEGLQDLGRVLENCAGLIMQLNQHPKTNNVDTLLAFALAARIAPFADSSPEKWLGECTGVSAALNTIIDKNNREEGKE